MSASPERSEHADHWTLEPGLDFLNHGSFGACPTRVIEAQRAWQARCERQPMDFFVRDWMRMLADAMAPVAEMIGAPPSELAFVRNATQAVNAVFRALTFAPGDQILTTDQAYGACAKTLRFVARRWGAEVVVVDLPWPGATEDAVVAAIEGGVTERTKIALIDHITSPTGLVLPIARIVSSLQGRGVDVMVDGAHAVGMVPLDLTALGAAYYTTNCHKWLCAPKGCALLHVRADRQEGLVPTSISHGAEVPAAVGAPFALQFGWTGTDDPTAWLTLPTAIEVVGGMCGGWDGVMARNRALALRGREILCERLGVEPPCPASMIGSLAAVPLPGQTAWRSEDPFALDPLQERLRHDHRIEVPIVPWPGEGRRLVRISAQLYNDETQYRRLADALTEELVRSG